MVPDTLRRTAREYFEGVSPSHDWHHVLRVRNTALDLAERENANPRILDHAAVLHDIGRAREDRGKIDDHARWSAEEARGLLEDRGYDNTLVDAITHCIRSHRYSNDVEPESREAKILCDADNLDALGAIGVARTFAYSGEQHRPLADGDCPPEADDTEVGRTGLNHLVKKILTLRDRMYTPSGRELAEKRHRVVEDFVEQLRDEIL